MDNPDSRNGSAHTEQNLVVVDRAALLQLLTAVSGALEASLNLDQLEVESDLDADQLAAVREEVITARQDLIAGIRRVMGSVEQLPAANLAPSGDNGDTTEEE
jgi:hypothetical protein